MRSKLYHKPLLLTLVNSVNIEDADLKLFFADGGKKIIAHIGRKVRVFTFLYTVNVDGLPKKYRGYWFDEVDTLLTSILAYA